MTPEAILSDLVAIADLPGASNARMAACILDHLARLGVECAVLPGPEGDRVNLFATLGPRDVPGYVLSGHMDVVPTEGQIWSSDPFRLRAEGGRLYGRGATDMKGYLACLLAMVPEFQAMGLRRPIHLAFSYDEEIGCRGVGHMIARLPDLCAPPLGCIVGEPSDMVPVLSHKGKQAVELRIEGQAAHSSQPDLGVNAIYPAAELLLFIRDLAARLAAEGPFDARFSPACSTVVAGVVQGGAAVGYASVTLDWSTLSARRFAHLDCLYLQPGARGWVRFSQSVQVTTSRSSRTSMTARRSRSMMIVP